VIILGLILLIIGIIAVKALVFIGVIVLIIGLVLAILGGMGRAIGGRKHWY
jgi:hypothetical protein